MKETIINIEDLKQDDLNFNLGSEVGKELLEKSFRELGAGRSVLVDKDNRLIGGNKAQQAAIAAGIKKVRVIDTDGTELVAVRRTDVTLDSKQGRDLALADNSTAAANLRWDEDAIKAAQEQWSVDAEEWGVPAEWEQKTEQGTTTGGNIGGLPVELQGLDIEPDELPKIEGNDETLMQRVIIVYPAERAEVLAALLGLPQIDKVLYNIEELVPTDNEE